MSCPNNLWSSYSGTFTLHVKPESPAPQGLDRAGAFRTFSWPPCAAGACFVAVIVQWLDHAWEETIPIVLHAASALSAFSDHWGRSLPTSCAKKLKNQDRDSDHDDRPIHQGHIPLLLKSAWCRRFGVHMLELPYSGVTGRRPRVDGSLPVASHHLRWSDPQGIPPRYRELQATVASSPRQSSSQTAKRRSMSPGSGSVADSRKPKGFLAGPAEAWSTVGTSPETCSP